MPPQVLQHPHGITIFEDTVYWSERYTSKVMSTNKFRGGNVTIEMNDVYQPMGIVMDHATKQPEGKFNQILQVRNLLTSFFFFFISFCKKEEAGRLIG